MDIVEVVNVMTNGQMTECLISRSRRVTLNDLIVLIMEIIKVIEVVVAVVVIVGVVVGVDVGEGAVTDNKHKIKKKIYYFKNKS